MLLIPVDEKLRQEDCFKASLGYNVRPCLKITTITNSDNILKLKLGSEEMAQWLRALAALVEDPCSIPSSDVRQSVTPTSLASVGPCPPLHRCIHII